MKQSIAAKNIGGGDAQVAPPLVVQVEWQQLMPAAGNRPLRSGFDEKSLGELADSIRAHGVVQPLVVRPLHDGDRENGERRFEIVAGERRWRGAKLAGLAAVPCIVRSLNDTEAAEVRAVENLQRENLTAIEEAMGYQEMLSLRDGQGGGRIHTVQTIAVKLGKSEATIYGALKLLRLPEWVRPFLLDGTLATSIAILIARIPDAGLREKAAIEILRGNQYNPEDPKLKGAKARAEAVREMQEDAADPEGEDLRPLSFRQAKEHIQDSYMVRLKGCAFDLKDADLVPAVFEGEERMSGGACTDCPYRTGNMIDATSIGMERKADKGSADVCTNPACFAAKRAALHKRDAGLAKAEGQTILAPAKAERLFSEGQLRNWGGGDKFVDLQAKVNGGKTTWADLVPDAVTAPVVRARDDAGKMHYLAPREELREAFKAAKVKLPKELGAPRSNAGVDPKDWEKRQAKERAERAQRQAVSLAIAEELIKALRVKLEQKDPALAWWQWLLKQTDTYGDVSENSREFAAAAKGNSIADCMAVLMVSLADGAVEYTGELSKDFLEGCRLVGIDHKAIAKKVEQALKEAEAKATPAASATAEPVKGKKGKKGVAA